MMRVYPRRRAVATGEASMRRFRAIALWISAGWTGSVGIDQFLARDHEELFVRYDIGIEIGEQDAGILSLRIGDGPFPKGVASGVKHHFDARSVPDRRAPS